MHATRKQFPLARKLMREFRRLFKRPDKGLREWEYLPGGWPTNDSVIKGWNVPSVVEAQKKRWSQLRTFTQSTGPLGLSLEAAEPTNLDEAAHNTLMSFGYVLARTSRNRDMISILDWGGGLGQYLLYSRALLPEVRLEYHCKELPLLCHAGRLVNPEAIFHEDDQTAWKRTYDLVLASSSFQYSKDWRGQAARLSGATSGSLFITRLPVVRQAPSFVVVQRPYRYGYDTEYCCWFLNQSELLGHMHSIGMELRREFLVQEKPTVKNAPEQGEYRGFLFQSRGERPASE